MFVIRSLESGDWFLLLNDDVMPMIADWSTSKCYVFNNIEDARGMAGLLDESTEILQISASMW